MLSRFLIWIFLLLVVMPRVGFGQAMLPDTICEGGGERIYWVQGWPNSTFTWTVEGGTILPPVTNDTVTVDWTGVSAGIYSITVVEHAENGCSGDPWSGQVFIIPKPVVSLDLCIPLTSRDARSFHLKGGIPLNGMYSGTAVSQGIFYPGNLPPGQDTVIVRYRYTNVAGCRDSASAVLYVRPESNHTCGNLFTDPRDNQSYATLLFGTACWMTENLNYGNRIPSSSFQLDNCVPEKYCFNDQPEPCAPGSALYQWDELMEYAESDTVQGLCPPGWHVATEEEWQALIALFQNAAYAGSALKQTGYSGFNALLTGFYGNASVWRYGATDPTLNSTLFWTSTASGPGKSRAHGLNEVVTEPTFTTSVSSYSSSRANAFSVRCVKNED